MTTIGDRSRLGRVGLGVFVIAVGVAGASPARAETPTTPPDRDPRNEARALFETGVAQFDRGEWSAALAAFLRSREIYPTRSATKNAAVCLGKENRPDEALEMFEALLREFKDLPSADRSLAEKEIESLRGAIGALEVSSAEPGASLVVDGRARGTYPPPGPLRVGAGSHMVRVYKEGFLPFERRVDVAGRQTVLVEARLLALTRAGRLSVTESTGANLDVVVDNVVVGKTPWEGSVAVGAHTIVLRGGETAPGEDRGTQPTTTTVKLGEVTRLALAAEPLGSGLRIVPVPAGASVSIDSVVVGQGVWEGKLREGSHKIEIAEEGFVPVSRQVRLVKNDRAALTIALERDLSSPLWRRSHPARVYAGIDAGPLLGLVYGGDVRSSCTGACSADVPLGLSVTAHTGYETSSGFTLGVDVGWLVVSAGVTARPAQVLPRGLAANSGVADESLGLRGFRFGPSGGVRLGELWPVTLRFGAGIFLGSAVDARTGRFSTAGGAAYGVDVSESVAASYVYLAPEAQVARRLTAHVEVGVGLSVLALLALDQPSWRNDQTILAAPPGQQGDGLGTFPRESTAGSFLLGVVPGVDARYAF